MKTVISQKHSQIVKSRRNPTAALISETRLHKYTMRRRRIRRRNVQKKEGLDKGSILWLSTEDMFRYCKDTFFQPRVQTPSSAFTLVMSSTLDQRSGRGNINIYIVIMRCFNQFSFVVFYFAVEILNSLVSGTLQMWWWVCVYIEPYAIGQQRQIVV